MNTSRVIVVIIVILLAVAILSFLSKPASKIKPQPVPVPLEMEKPSVQVDLQVTKKATEKEVVVVKQSQKVVGLVTARYPIPFWGNKGYLIKGGKSTFVKPSILEQLKKTYETQQAAPAIK